MGRRLQAGAILVAMFATGAFAGYRYASRPMRSAMKAPPLPVESVAPYEPLGLSAEQRQRIETIFREARPATDLVMDSIQSRLRARLDSIEAAVRAVLDPAQRRMLDSLRDSGALLPNGVRMRRPNR